DTTAEDAEQRELWAALSAAQAAARGPVYVLDLHTTSADGYPFVVAGEGDASRAFALTFGPTLFHGLMARLPGALVPYLGAHGFRGAAIEGRQNGSATSVDRLAAAIRVALAELGLLAAGDTSAAGARALLEAARKDLPREVEIVARHPVTAGDEFRMEPGFAN